MTSEKIQTLGADELLQKLFDNFSTNDVSKAIGQQMELDELGRFVVFDKEDKIVYRGTQTECMNYWLELIDEKYKVCEVSYNSFFNLDTKEYAIASNLEIVRIIIE